MFDRITYAGGPSHVSVTKTVNEHRAPTDASVRLLNEMQDKAVENVMRSAVLVGDGIKVAFIERRPDVDGFGSTIHLSFKFNGKWEIVKCKLDEQKGLSLREDGEAFIRWVSEQVSARISRVIFERLIRAVAK